MALFLTRPELREKAPEASPSPEEEILCDANETERTLALVNAHTKRWNQSLCGVVSYDCESLLPAAILAESLGLVFPSPEAIRISRSKILTRKRWAAAGVATPAMLALTHPAQASGFFAHTGGPVVLKPACGSGSELVFLCEDGPSSALAFRRILQGLSERREALLYAPHQSLGESILAEAFVHGPEFSCDLLLSSDAAHIIRLTEKVSDPGLPFGTAMAYLHPARLPQGVSRADLETLFFKAADAIGLRSGVAMIDFIVSDKGPVLIEMTPRPGGDCLPWLIQEALGIDTISLALDAAKETVRIPTFRPQALPLIGLRLHAREEGRISGIVSDPLRSDPRVRALHLSKTVGDTVALPPKDYDSWVLGHLIFTPQNANALFDECITLKQKLQLAFETP
jgi:biotin carboxylase